MTEPKFVAKPKARLVRAFFCASLDEDVHAYGPSVHAYAGRVGYFSVQDIDTDGKL